MTDRHSHLRRGLVAAWCPSLGFGPRIADRSNSSVHGTIASPVAAANGSNIAANCDGTTDQSVLSIASTRLDQVFGASATITAWVRLRLATPTEANKTGVFKCDNNTGESFPASHYPWIDGTAYISTWRTARVNAITLSSAVDRTRWHLLAITTDGNRWRMYQNDILVSDIAAQASVSFSSSLFRVGLNNVGTSFFYRLDGFYDDVRLYNRALTRAEIALLATQRGIGLVPTRHRRANVLGSQFWLRDAGTWKKATPWINVSGTWKKAAAKLNVTGTWK